MKITAELLERLNACPEQQQAFQQHYPDGAELTAAGLLQARKQGFNILWLAYRLPFELRLSIERKACQETRNDIDKAAAYWQRWAELLVEAYTTFDEQQLTPYPYKHE